MSGFQTNMLEGVADLLAAAGVAKWNPTGTYADTDTGIMIQLVPPSPAAVVTLSAYVVTDDPFLSDSVIGMQVRARTGGSDPRPTNDLADAVFDQIHGLRNTTLNTGVRVVECLRRSGALLGQDELRRWLRSDNYYVTVWRPSPNRI